MKKMNKTVQGPQIKTRNIKKRHTQTGEILEMKNSGNQTETIDASNINRIQEMKENKSQAKKIWKKLIHQSKKLLNFKNPYKKQTGNLGYNEKKKAKLRFGIEEGELQLKGTGNSLKQIIRRNCSPNNEGHVYEGTRC